ncbi:hypothetical protein VTN00DRAFT_9615 [Thermoascus crustaceus]|uniref:uncharacterized protein n=1 Tax=Thermoascus crustaceus TaxID=5088 RepID=UPI003743F948
MPFGLTNAPATFQSLVNNTLWKYLDVFCMAYLDDILIYSETLEEHRQHVWKVLEALKEKKLSVAPEKCEWHTQRTEFLGFMISPGHVEMNEGKKFIWNYSKIVEPLTKLTRKDQKFEWKKEQQKAFDLLKQKFCEAPVLGIFDPEKPIFIETDASDFAIGACINQPDEQGRLHPIAFYSRKMTPPELNYNIHDKELLAIMAAVKEWQHYLEGAKHQVVIYCDHKNLAYFTTSKELTRRQVRWAEELAPYDIKITYRRGSENA